MKNQTNKLSPKLLGVISIGTLIALWWVVTTLRLIEPLFLPSPQAVLAKLYLVATDGFMNATLWQHLSASLSRMLWAVVFAIITGVSLGVAIGLSPVVRGLIDPIIELYRPIPPLAYLPLLVIWFGIGETTKVLLIYLAIFAPIVIATAQGMQVAQGNRIRAVRSLGASGVDILHFVILPSALPDILTGIRIGLGVGWSTLVAAELVAARHGLGFMVQSAAQFLVTDVVIMGILVIAVIAISLEIALRILQKRLVPWQGHE